MFKVRNLIIIVLVTCAMKSFGFAAPPPCGDGSCGEEENCANCPDDCGPCDLCGDGSCGEKEDCANCPDDCGPCDLCGDGSCGEEEDCTNCPDDCGPCDLCEGIVCDDGDACTIDACIGGGCQLVGAVDCDDGLILTRDYCDPLYGCIQEPFKPLNCGTCAVQHFINNPSLKLMDVNYMGAEFSGSETTFNYRVCARHFELAIDYWILGMSSGCCERLVATSHHKGQPKCEYDPETQVFGLRFDIGRKATPICSDDPTFCGFAPNLPGITWIRFAGRVPMGCSLAGSSISGIQDPFPSRLVSIIGPDCEGCGRLPDRLDINGDNRIDLEDAAEWFRWFTGP